jgi:transposase-like protein
MVPNRRYTDELKVEAVRLMDSFGLAVNWVRRRAMYKWRDKVKNGELSVGDGKVVPIKSGSVDLVSENDRLGRELANAKFDLDILKKGETQSQTFGECWLLECVFREPVTVKYAWIQLRAVDGVRFKEPVKYLKCGALVINRGWFAYCMLRA